MADNPNELLLGLSISSAVNAERFKSDLARRVRQMLREIDERLVAEISRKLENLSALETHLLAVGKYTTRRLKSLRDSIDKLEERSKQELLSFLRTEGVAFGTTDSASAAEALRRVAVSVGIEVEAARTLSKSSVRAILTQEPFDGKLLKEYVEEWGTAKRAAVLREIRLGLLAGESVPKITSRLFGTKSRLFKDGALFQSRTSAENLVRTAISHVMNGVREDLYEANADVIKGVRWVSTLDSRTCPVCASLDGKIFPLKSGPRPPIHRGDRCIAVGQVRHATGSLHLTRAAKPHEVPSSWNFERWLKDQPSDVQKKVLGASRWRLWKDGGLELDGFIDRTGRKYTLDELREDNEAAFKRAGL